MSREIGHETENSLRRVPEADGEDDRSPDAIRRDIELRRESIARTVDQAGRMIHESLSWREQVREHPFGAIALAAGTGFVLAGMLRSRETIVERVEAALVGNVEEVGRSLRNVLRSAARPQHGVVRAVGAALTAVATQSAASAAWKRVVQGAPAPATEISTPASLPREIIKERKHA